MPWLDDCRDSADAERAPEREVLELGGEDRALLGRLAQRLGMQPSAVVRLALISLARGRVADGGLVR
jgi:hypothetical protein